MKIIKESNKLNEKFLSVEWYGDTLVGTEKSAYHYILRLLQSKNIQAFIPNKDNLHGNEGPILFKMTDGKYAVISVDGITKINEKSY